MLKDRFKNQDLKIVSGGEKIAEIVKFLEERGLMLNFGDGGVSPMQAQFEELASDINQKMELITDRFKEFRHATERDRKLMEYQVRDKLSQSDANRL